MNKNITLTIRIITFLIFVAMIIVNALANALPINNLNTGQVSNFYQSLFTPTSFTFSIWGVIYLLLSIYAIYQLLILNKTNKNQLLLNEISLYFTFSSIINMLWIFAWHYLYILLSVFLMIILLALLIKIYNIINNQAIKKINFLIKLPFSIYFGWITIATLANINSFLVSLNISALNDNQYILTILSLIIGLFIGVKVSSKNNDLAYLSVIIWAYIGVLFKHIAPSGFNGKYISIIYVLIFSLLILFINLIKIRINHIRIKKSLNN